MNLDELREINRVTEGLMAGMRAGTIPPSPVNLPYYGYLTVDVFDCPPFIMFTNDDSPVVGSIIMSGTFEPCSIALWCALARKASGIVDIGANVGIYSLCAAALRSDLLVHAFEPNPYAFARLRVHKFVNEFQNLADHPIALGSKSAFFKLSWAVKPGGNIASGAGLGPVPDKTLPAESAVAQGTALDESGITPSLGERPLVKIDVEGAEAQVIRGAKDLMAKRPDIIVECLEQNACDELTRELLPLGYSIYGIYENEMMLRRRERFSRPDHTANLNHFVTTRTSEEVGNLGIRGLRAIE